MAGDTPPRPVLASDGAIWEVTRFGELARVVGEDASVVVPGHGFQGPAAFAPAGGGAVWAVVDGDVVRIAPDGARSSIGRSEGVARIDPYNPIAALGDDAVWAVGQWGDVHLWDGQEWSDLPAVPGTSVSVVTLLAVPDGSLWLLDGMDIAGTSTLLRLHEGRWSTGPAGMRGLAAAPDGAVCSMGLDQVDIVCLDAGLTVVRTIPVVGRPVRSGSPRPARCGWPASRWHGWRRNVRGEAVAGGHGGGRPGLGMEHRVRCEQSRTQFSEWRGAESAESTRATCHEARSPWWCRPVRPG